MIVRVISHHSIYFVIIYAWLYYQKRNAAYCLSGEGVPVDAPLEVHAEVAGLLAPEGAGAAGQDLDRLRVLRFSQSQKLFLRGWFGVQLSEVREDLGFGCSLVVSQSVFLHFLDELERESLLWVVFNGQLLGIRQIINLIGQQRFVKRTLVGENSL